MEANWVFEMQRNYITVQTPRCFSVYSHFTEIQFYKTETCSCTSQACETVKEKILIDWENVGGGKTILIHVRADVLL